jgi:23S rRNA (uracil1939-C5)-methyltransferase
VSAPRPGETLELRIEKGVYRGLGLARHEGQVVFVPRALAGDQVRVRVDSVSRGYLQATLLDVLQPAAERRASPCPFVPRCGGCSYQPLSYDAQLSLKQAILRESLERAGVEPPPEISVRASPEQAWRTRATFHLQQGSDGFFQLGLREEGSHRVVDLEQCLQLSAEANQTLRALRAALAERPHLARAVKDVVVAESVDGSQRVAALESHLDPKEATALAGLADGLPWLSGFGVTVGEERRRRFLSLRGDPHVVSSVLGLGLRAHVRSFFQSNRFLVEDLVRGVVALVPPGGRVLDLYAGVGLFALAVAARAEEVLGVELNPSAVEDAMANARQAGLGHVRVRQGDVRASLASWPVVADERVILDPPRTGAGAQVVKDLVARRPRSVVYVSCDPPTLARDLKQLTGSGYRLDSLAAFDMFPDTFHLESVASLSRA